MSLIVLWDIDHTLIENSGVSKEIYGRAYTLLTGVPPAGAAATEGRTDRLIMRSLFEQHALTEPAWPQIEAALTQAGQERAEALRARGRALPGVRTILKTASTRGSWVSSVLTGNIRANARVKLAAFELDGLVDLNVGAYGADAEQRPALVDVARARVRDRYGLPTKTPLVLVGDTPRDVEAAQVAGAHIIAVATGVHSQTELSRAGAALVLPDLSDTAGLIGLLERCASQ
ncbi:HAD family hydrolase [Streptomyces violascens]|uniref:HAD family hydrolase n=1 Tax=Streptomyces violascens TaxID=67381 RepID=UPI00378C00EF